MLVGKYSRKGGICNTISRQTTEVSVKIIYYVSNTIGSMKKYILTILGSIANHNEKADKQKNEKRQLEYSLKLVHMVILLNENKFEPFKDF